MKYISVWPSTFLILLLPFRLVRTWETIMCYRLKGLRNLICAYSCILISINLTIRTGDTGYVCHYDKGNFSRKDAYYKNRNLILSSLAFNVTIKNGGFHEASTGQDPNKVYALALCRGDITSDEDCVNCVKATSQEIITTCPDQKEAFMWGGGERPCLVRYGDHPISGVLDLPPRAIQYGGNLTENVRSNLTNFHQIWESLMDELVKQVTTSPSSLKFATKEANLNDFQKISTLLQCTPDLSQSDCDVCLRQNVADFQVCCSGSGGGNVQRANCYLEWSLNAFYSPHTDALLPVTTPSSGPPGDNHIGIKCKTFPTIINIIVAAAVIMISINFTGIIIYVVKKSRKEFECVERIKYIKYFEFNMDTIKVATNNFSDANKLGRGGFSVVYKGTLLNGQEIAVKRLHVNSKHEEEKFKNEVTLVAKLQHRNLAKLLGFCMDQKESILVYEFLPNSSLNHFIFDPIKREILDWERRYKIIGGIARGLLYLHEDSNLRIIHRDLKASNILLDSEMNPKISDFGTARLFEMDQTHSSTVEVVGTFGYMAPEYIIHRHFSLSTDVYSFGVLLLEIVSGQKRSCFGTEEETKCLLTYAWKRWNEGTTLDLIDSTLREGSKDEMMKCIHIALLCVQESVSVRPSMASVVHMLNSNSIILPEPLKPGFFMQSPDVVKVSPSSSSLEHNFELNEPNQLEISIVPLSQNKATVME